MRITVYGEPTAQGRPRFTTRTGYAKAYDPQKSRDAKDYIRLAAVQQMHGAKPLDGALSLGIQVYRSMPKSFSRRKVQAAEAKELRPVTKPDLDNYVKLIKDALKLICWKDDSQVAEYVGPFGKYYSETPRIVIEVNQL